MAKKKYKVKSNNNPKPLAESKTLNERLLSIGTWLAMGSIDDDSYLWCLETAFEHWGWTPPKSE